jgi:hypothetical protein
MFRLTLTVLMLSINFCSVAANNSVEVEGDPQVSGSVDSAIKKDVLPEGNACEVLPPKNNCDVRLMCYAQSRIYNKNSESKQAAIQDAKELIKEAYVEFVEGVKVDKNKNCSRKVGRLMENNQGKERISKLCESITTYATSGSVIGLEAISVRTDWKANEVTVVMGRRCEGVNLIDKLKSQDAGIKSSPSKASSNNSVGDKGMDKTKSVDSTDQVEDRLYQKQDF